MERDRAAGVTSLSVVGSRVQSRKPSPVKTGDGGNSKEADDHEVKEKRKLDNIITCEFISANRQDRLERWKSQTTISYLFGYPLRLYAHSSTFLVTT
jgi:hypothetical protein